MEGGVSTVGRSFAGRRGSAGKRGEYFLSASRVDRDGNERVRG